jgi:hypothetical protein
MVAEESAVIATVSGWFEGDAVTSLVPAALALDNVQYIEARLVGRNMVVYGDVAVHPDINVVSLRLLFSSND